MRPIVITYSGPTSALPIDIYQAKAEFQVTMSGTGTLQYTNNDPFNWELVPLVWTTVSPGTIQIPLRAFRAASGAGTLLITQFGPPGGGG